MSYDSDNIFAKILQGEIPNDTVYEDDNLLAFNDISPAAPVHVLIIPKGEYTSFDDFAAKAGSEVIASYFKTIRDIAQKLGVAEAGYRLITNHGSDASQTVPHFHMHLLAGEPLGGLLPGDRKVR